MYAYDQQHTDSINANFSEADQFGMFNVDKNNGFGVKPWHVEQPEDFTIVRTQARPELTPEQRAARVEQMRALYAVLEPQGISPFSEE